MVELSKLEVALENSWVKETSSDPDAWNEENPAWGQCAVTALVVNDYLGGKLVWASASLPDGREISHYFNLVDDMEIDFTRRQFPAGTVVPQGVDKTKNFETTRDYVLSFEITQKRYETLKRNVEDFFNFSK